MGLFLPRGNDLPLSGHWAHGRKQTLVIWTAAIILASLRGEEIWGHCKEVAGRNTIAHSRHHNAS